MKINEQTFLYHKSVLVLVFPSSFFFFLRGRSVVENLSSMEICEL